MNSQNQPKDWSGTDFDDSRREQLRRAQKMSLRQRLEALDQLAQLSDRLQAMPKRYPMSPGTAGAATVREPAAQYRKADPANVIVLAGCTPTPLANYLKALGVLRLLSGPYPAIRAAWRDEAFVLHAPIDRTELERFFLCGYQPTPVIAPWNGGSGFYYQERKSNEKDPATGKKKKLGVRDQPTEATKTVDAVVNSACERLRGYKAVLALAKQLVSQFGLVRAPENGEPKDNFIRALRGVLPEGSLDWLDAALVVTAESTQFPPLLGTGGNDGNMDFTSNFMQRLLELIDPTTGAPTVASADWLRLALFDDAAPGLTKGAIGQFSPGRAGGPNASAGFEADPAINPWDFVLMIEGALSFAAAAVRRNADDAFGVLSYPFTVRAVGAGAGNLGGGDAAASRGELWMPLWDQSASFAEIRALLAEGRVALGKKPARDALDFVRAVHQLGGYRGIRSFQRYGLLMRSGKAYLATPLERVNVSDEQPSNLLDELDQRDWLAKFRRFAQGDNTANRFIALRQRLENAFFEFAGQLQAPSDVQSVLALLGEIQTALANSKKAVEVMPPVPRLSERWVQMADDGTPAFRIARALAGLRGVGDIALSLRSQVFPAHRKLDQWAGADEKYRVHTGVLGRLPDTLHALLSRRLWLAEQLGMVDKPLASPACATLDDIAAFLHSDAMDQRIVELMPGLVLCDIPQDVERDAGEAVVPAAFGLLKLCVTPDATLRSLGALRESDKLRIPSGMLAQLAGGNARNRAVESAWRRLHASGLSPLFDFNALPQLGSVDPRRAVAALLIPLRYGATGALMRSVLRTAETPLEVA